MGRVSSIIINRCNEYRPPVGVCIPIQRVSNIRHQAKLVAQASGKVCNWRTYWPDAKKRDFHSTLWEQSLYRASPTTRRENTRAKVARMHVEASSQPFSRPLHALPPSVKHAPYPVRRLLRAAPFNGHLASSNAPPLETSRTIRLHPLIRCRKLPGVTRIERQPRWISSMAAGTEEAE